MSNYTAYINDNGTAVPFPGGQKSAAIEVLTSTSRPSAATVFVTPAYTVGSHELQVFLNGLLCVEGVDYTETAGNSITFSSPIAGDAQVTLLVTSGEEAVAVTVSQSRPSIIASGAAYDVPEHEVGANRLQVFVDGLLLMPVADYQEISKTQIVFTDSVPADRQIVIYRR